MRTFIGVVLSICWLLVSPAQAAESTTSSPAPGSKDRKDLMDAIRGRCERDLRQPVIFKVEQLKVSGDWAFVRVTPLKPNGKPVDYKQTKYKQAVEADMFDGLGEGLLRREGGRWTVIEWRFGATDTEIDTWASTHQLPKSLFR